MRAARGSRIAGLIGCLFLGFAVTDAAEVAVAPKPAGLYPDISYAATADSADPAQRLDIRVPEGAGPFPVVVLVHGGGWSGGDKGEGVKPGSGADIRPWFAPLTEAGFVWVSINYRLAPANRWPACLDDTRAAVAWTSAHIAEYGGDPERIAIMGHSAGGHLAFMAALPVDGKPSPVAAVVGCAGVSDLVSDTERRGGPSASLRMLFDLPESPAGGPALTPEVRARLAETSPLTHLAAGYPPTLLIHGDADKTVPIAQSRDVQARLTELGVSCDVHVLPGAGHRLAEWAAHDPAWTRVLTDWLRSRLGASAATANVPSQQ